MSNPLRALLDRIRRRREPQIPPALTRLTAAMERERDAVLGRIEVDAAARLREFYAKNTPEQRAAIAAALRRDWEQVGADMYRGIDDFIDNAPDITPDQRSQLRAIRDADRRRRERTRERMAGA